MKRSSLLSRMSICAPKSLIVMAARVYVIKNFWANLLNLFHQINQIGVTENNLYNDETV
jgi:hypothetical protein